MRAFSKFQSCVPVVSLALLLWAQCTPATPLLDAVDHEQRGPVAYAIAVDGAAVAANAWRRLDARQTAQFSLPRRIIEFIAFRTPAPEVAPLSNIGASRDVLSYVLGNLPARALHSLLPIQSDSPPPKRITRHMLGVYAWSGSRANGLGIDLGVNAPTPAPGSALLIAFGASGVLDANDKP